MRSEPSTMPSRTGPLCVDPSIAAQMVNGMVNAPAEIERWVRGVDAGNVFALVAVRLFRGLHAPGVAAAGVLAATAATI